MAQVWWVSCSVETSAGQSPAQLTRPNEVGLWAGLMPVAREQAVKRTETAFSVRLGFAGCDCTEYDNEIPECGISPGGWCGETGHRKGRWAELNLCSKNPTPGQAEGRGSPAGTKPPDGAQDEGQGGAWLGPRGHVEGSHLDPQGSGKAPELVEGSAMVQF